LKEAPANIPFDIWHEESGNMCTLVVMPPLLLFDDKVIHHAFPDRLRLPKNIHRVFQEMLLGSERRLAVYGFEGLHQGWKYELFWPDALAEAIDLEHSLKLPLLGFVDLGTGRIIA
jgi:hypothetical protein